VAVKDGRLRPPEGLVLDGHEHAGRLKRVVDKPLLIIDRREITDRGVSAAAIIERGLRTPTRPFFANYFIDITPGPAAVFACMKRLRRPMVSSSAAR